MPLCGDIVQMPGPGKTPAALNIDIDEQGTDGRAVLSERTSSQDDPTENGGAIEVPLADLPLGEVLERVAARTPAPGAGSSLALTCALAAALAEMAARF